VRRRRRLDPSRIDLHRHGPLKQSDRNHHAVPASYRDQNTFYAGEHAVTNADVLTGVQKRHWFSREAGFHNRPHSFEFRLVDRERFAAGSDDTIHSRDRQDRQAPGQIHVTEEISGEDRNIDIFDPVRPCPAASVEWEEFFIATVANGRRNQLFVSRPDL
jgi:hypothetical protein